jgi:hypothetical protein
VLSHSISALAAVGQELNVARRNCCLSSVAVRCAVYKRCKRMSLGALQVAALAKRAALFATCASNCAPAHDTQRTATPESVAAFSLRCCSAGVVVHARACECVRTRPQWRRPWASVSVTAAVWLPPCSQRAVRQPCCAALRCNTYGLLACFLACLLAWQAVAQRSGALHVCGESAHIRDGNALGSPLPHLHRD